MFVGMNTPHRTVEPVPPSLARNRWGCTPVALWLAAIVLMPGCIESKAKLLGEFLDEVEIDEPLESAVYVPLGRFQAPLRTTISEQGKSRTVTLRLSFNLFAEAPPQNEAAVAAAVERNRGALNDAVLTIIRTSTSDELTDPRLSGLKLRLNEAARPLLGQDAIRQLVLNDVRPEIL